MGATPLHSSLSTDECFPTHLSTSLKASGSSWVVALSRQTTAGQGEPGHCLALRGWEASGIGGAADQFLWSGLSQQPGLSPLFLEGGTASGPTDQATAVRPAQPGVGIADALTTLPLLWRSRARGSGMGTLLLLPEYGLLWESRPSPSQGFPWGAAGRHVEGHLRLRVPKVALRRWGRAECPPRALLLLLWPPALPLQTGPAPLEPLTLTLSQLVLLRAALAPSWVPGVLSPLNFQPWPDDAPVTPQQPLSPTLSNSSLGSPASLLSVQPLCLYNPLCNSHPTPGRPGLLVPFHRLSLSIEIPPVYKATPSLKPSGSVQALSVVSLEPWALYPEHNGTSSPAQPPFPLWASGKKDQLLPIPWIEVCPNEFSISLSPLLPQEHKVGWNACVLCTGIRAFAGLYLIYVYS